MKRVPLFVPLYLKILISSGFNVKQWLKKYFPYLTTLCQMVMASLISECHTDECWRNILIKVAQCRVENKTAKVLETFLLNCQRDLLFLGGLCLHLNHLIASRAANYDWPFGTLPFGLFGSNLDTRYLETYPRTYSDHF